MTHGKGANAHPLHWPEGWPRSVPLGRKGLGAFTGLTPLRAYTSLLDELKKLGATSVVVSSNARVLNNGHPSMEESGERLNDPGVAVYFSYQAKPMVMAQDIFSRPYVNMRSLAIAIDALRAIGRHGGGHMMTRSFAGFTALPPPGGEQAAVVRRPWREVLELVGFTGPSFAVLAGAEAAYRTLAKVRHPDMANGSPEAFAELAGAIEDAREELR